MYPDQGLLVGEKGELHLEPKVMEVLIYLAERQDQVVRRDDLIKDVWHGTFVSDEVLSRAISLLRTSLGDDRMTPFYIQTLPKVGYRLLMEVTPLAEPESEPQPEPGLSQKESRVLKPYSRHRRRDDYYRCPSCSGRQMEKRLTHARRRLLRLSRNGLIFWQRKNKVQKASPPSPYCHSKILSENNDSTYFSEGLTDELTMTLSKVKGLKVVARRSSYSFQEPYR